MSQRPSAARHAARAPCFFVFVISCVLTSPPADLPFVRPVLPWPAPRHRRLYACAVLRLSPIVASNVAPSFSPPPPRTYSAWEPPPHAVTVAAAATRLRRTRPRPLPRSTTIARPRGLLPYLLLCSPTHPPLSRDRGFASVCIAPLAAPCTPSLCRNINIFAAFFLSLPRGCGRAILRVVGEGPDVNLNRRGAASSISSSS